MLTLGEVHTGLLLNSTSVPPERCSDILTLLLGEQTPRADRPVAYTASPRLLTGVDCHLPAASGARPRVVGTVASHAVVTGGQILQGCAFTHVTAGTANRRLPWSYYLAQPGTVETIGRADPPDVAAGFLDAPSGDASTLDLGAVGTRMMDTVQRRPGLDRRPPLRAARTRLRWLVESQERAPAQVSLTVQSPELRTLRLVVRAAELPEAIALCEDVALHDWLLSTLIRELERSRPGAGDAAWTVRALTPAIRHLLHLWMPAARLAGTTAALWDALDGRAGLSRQWQVSVARIRDEVSLSMLSGLGALAASGPSAGGSGPDAVPPR